MMELELIPRPCPFCGDVPDVHCYHSNGKLNMCNIGCYNEYCMVQPGIQMYGSDSQRNAVAYWNGERKVISEERASEIQCKPGAAHIYHSVSSAGNHAYWCGNCGHLLAPMDHYCSDCGYELIEIVEV